MKKLLGISILMVLLSLNLSAQKHCNTEFAYKLGQSDAQNYQEKKQINMGMRCKKDTAYTQEDFERDYNRGYDEKMATLPKTEKDTTNSHPTCTLTEMGYTTDSNLASNFQIDDKDGIKDVIPVYVPECMTFKLTQITSTQIMKMNFDLSKMVPDRAVVQLNSGKMANITRSEVVLKVIDNKGNQEEVTIKLVAK